MTESGVLDVPLHVLFVTDNEASFAHLQHQMSEQDQRLMLLEWSNEYDTARALIQHDRYDAYLIDAWIGPQSGLDFLQEALAFGCKVPLVLLTNQNNAGLLHQAMRRGASDTLFQETLTPDILERSIRYAMGRHRAGVRLQESEEKFRTLYENAPLGIVIARRDGTILQSNEAFRRLSGASAAELERSNFYDLLDTTDPRNTEEVPRLFAPTPSMAVEAVCLHADGSSIPVLMGSAQFQDRRGNHQVCLFVEDISERKKLQDHQLQTGRLDAVGRLATNVTRELNEYLDTMQTKLQQILDHEQPHLSEPGQRELELVIDQCKSLHNLTSGVMARQKQQLVAEWNVDKVLSQLRLRLLREPGSANLRKYFPSPQGKADLTARLYNAARRSDPNAGLDELREWLLHTHPPLLLPTDAPHLWQRIQPIFREALRELRHSIMEASQEANIPPLPMSSPDWPAPSQVYHSTPLTPLSRDEPSSRTSSHTSMRTPATPLRQRKPLPQRTSPPTPPPEPPGRFQVKPTPPPVAPPRDTNRAVAVPSEQEFPLPPQLENLYERMLKHANEVHFHRWLNRKSLSAFLRRHLHRHQDDAALPLEPLWETFQKVPGIEPRAVQRFFRLLMNPLPTVAVEAPAFLQQSSYDSFKPPS